MPSNDEASGDCSKEVAGNCDGECTVFEKDYIHLFSFLELTNILHNIIVVLK